MELKRTVLWIALALLAVGRVGGSLGCLDVSTGTSGGCLGAGRLCSSSAECCSGLACLYVPQSDPALAECR